MCLFLIFIENLKHGDWYFKKDYSCFVRLPGILTSILNLCCFLGGIEVTTWKNCEIAEIVGLFLG